MEIFKLFGSIGIKNQDANRAIDETTGKAESASGRIGETFKKMAGFLGTLFAGKAIFDFGKSVVEAAATAKAINAQFESVFGELEPQARNTVKKMADEMGILPNRLNPMFSKLSAKYKGLGATTEEAMTLAARGTTLAADAAAFYDKSLEETSSALNSFINGNYEGGEAIGLFANETQLAKWASDNLGVSWKDLDEKGKQVIRLQFAEAMQEASRATGQASREADSFENVMGNLKQAWEDFKAIVGGPLLAPVVSGLQSAIEWMGKAQDFVTQLYAKLQENGAIQSFKSAFDNVKSVIDIVVGGISDFVGSLLGIDENTSSVEAVATAVEDVAKFLEDATGKVKDFVTWFEQGGTAVDVLKSAIVGVTAAWTGYQVVTGIIQGIETVRNGLLALGNGLMLARFVQTGALTAAEGAQAAATMGATGAFQLFNMVLMANPIVIVIGLIAALVAGLIWFFTQTETGRQMWSDFMAFLSQTWENIVATATEKWSSFSAWISGLWSSVTTAGQDIWSSFVTTITNFFANLIAGAQEKWQSFSSGLSSLWTSLVSTGSNLFTDLKNKVSSIFEGIRSKASEIWDGIKSKISGAINGAKDAVKSAIDTMRGFFNFSWSLPRPSLPRFSVSGGQAPWGFMGKGSLPSIGIEWFAKGGIMTAPTMFGMNGPNAMVGGEAGPEAILPLNNQTLKPIGQAVAEAWGVGQSDNAGFLLEIIELLKALLLKEGDVYLDLEKVGRLTYEEHGRLMERGI